MRRRHYEIFSTAGNLAALPLDLWYEAPYTGGVFPTNWASLPSAGTSGSDAFNAADNSPNNAEFGDPLNGYTTAQFLRDHIAPQIGSKVLPGPVLISYFATKFGYSGGTLFKSEIAESDVINYLNPSILTVNGGPAVGITYSDNGLDYFQLDWDGISPLTNDNYSGVNLPCSLNAWHGVVFRYTGTNIEMSLDKSPWVTLGGKTLGLFGFDDLDIQWGLNGVAAHLWQGKMASTFMSKTIISRANLETAFTFWESRYNLSF